MNPSLADDGYAIHRGVLDAKAVSELRDEADLVAKATGTACVRHLRRRSDLFNDLSSSGALLSILPTGLRPVRSILFDKTPTENWPVLWHQDLTIAVTEKRITPGYGPWSHKDGSPHVQPPISLLENMVTIRLHLDETSANNGALRVIPQSHKGGKIVPDALAKYIKGTSTTCECEAGDVLLMSPLILHSSRRSTEPNRRRVIHFEYAREEDLDPALEWLESAISKSGSPGGYAPPSSR